MILSKIMIQHFRNIHSAEVLPSSSMNFIIGENGSGKTNFLESLYTLGHGRAFRHHQHGQLIEYQQDNLSLFAKVLQQQQEFNIGLSKHKNGQSIIKINNNTDYRIADLARLIPIQLMNPEGISLLVGGPKYKRAFLDWGCFHLYSEFYPSWAQFKRILKQRNHALRQTMVYEDLAHWDKQLIIVSEKIHALRAQYIASFTEQLDKMIGCFLPNFTFNYQFISGWESHLDYQESLLKNFTRDRLLKHTTTGPHKADFRIKVNQYPAEEYLSRGQLKLLMCALRLAQGQHFYQQVQHPCLYLLDDFTAELDATYQQLLMQQLRNLNTQVFISAIDLKQISSLLNEKDKIFKVVCGKIAT